MAEILLGTQGWSYADWVGTFYPPHSKQEDYLPFYARVFRTVELDTTFYHAPKPSIVRSWARHTPEAFRFAAKVPQAITHTARLARMEEQMQAFVAALAPLGTRRGPLLVQMPADFASEPGTVGLLDRFLSACPAEARIAVEFRNRSWHQAETAELLRKRGACAAWTDWRELPRWPVITTDFLYLRWMGTREQVEDFGHVQVDRTRELDEWERTLAPALPQVREVYGFFNNHWAGHSPASALELMRRLGLAVEEPRRLWPQGELW
jgi:uncharacterized protein YecE (DUF72 family)